MNELILKFKSYDTSEPLRFALMDLENAINDEPEEWGVNLRNDCNATRWERHTAHIRNSKELIDELTIRLNDFIEVEHDNMRFYKDNPSGGLFNDGQPPSTELSKLYTNRVKRIVAKLNASE